MGLRHMRFRATEDDIKRACKNNKINIKWIIDYNIWFNGALFYFE